ncbi:hypothetical protein [Haloarcula sp. JP-L23]|uniref:hypothetical protein n=1 Tax=Haloarcula sp. JP-L23 TaxID=2716717 RepID=UPI00140EFC24|nr:hypothetical protein G9465_15720 [Haloarcula sp. JP-L23]
MADIRVRYVDYRDEQAANQPFPVEVGINNLETVGPVGWGPVVCPDSGAVNNGHMTDVTLTIRDSTGSVVETLEEPLCVPVNRPSLVGQANATAEFQPSLPPGEYTVTAEVAVRGNNGTDTSQPQSLTVSEGTDSLPGGDADRGFWQDPGPDGNDGGTDGSDPFAAIPGVTATEAKVGGGLVVLLVLLWVAAPYASLGASLAGGGR